MKSVLQRFLCHQIACGAMLCLLPLVVGLTTASADAPTIHEFSGSDGKYPQSSLILGNDGNFYGTTFSGGADGRGTVFQMNPAGAVTTLVQFSGSSGYHPQAALLLGRDGAFYGTTYHGGNNGENNGEGDGTVFRLTSNGTPSGTTLTTLINFHLSNGSHPSTLILGRDGAFYGTTFQGGSSNDGTVFRLSTDGTQAGTTLTTLVDFNGDNGANPYAALIQGRDGNFYGTTYYGGRNFNGTLFKLATDGTHAGTTLTTLVTCDYSQGEHLQAALIQGRDGSFYGTAELGGIGNGGGGTVFKVTTDGTAAGTTRTTLVNFSAYGNDFNRAHPKAALIEASDGSFYGTTSSGGVYGDGTVFKVTTNGTLAGTMLTPLLNFNGANGAHPIGALVPGSDGSFYGTTSSGGGSDKGTVFKITPDGAPTADNSGQTTRQNQPVPIALTYFDPQGNQSAQSVALGIPAHGTLTGQSVSYDPISGLGIIAATYTPDTGFTGTDSGNFTVTNGLGTSNIATYSLFIGPFALQSLKFNPLILMGGDSVEGEVTLTAPAASPTIVTLTSSHSSVLPIRSSVTITPGHRTAHFSVASHSVTTTTEVVLTTTLGEVTTTSAVLVSAPAAPLSSVETVSASIKGGDAVRGEATLALPTVSPVIVSLTSSNPSVLSVRRSVTVTGMHRHALFTASSHAVTTVQTVTITAVANGVTKTCVVTVTP